MLLAANQHGEKKFIFLMIGHYKTLRCFAKIKSLPILYSPNIKAWITNAIFADCHLGIGKKMAINKMHIFIFIDIRNVCANIPTLKKK